MKWEEELLKKAREIVIKGGKLELVVYKREFNKRRLLLHSYPENKTELPDVEVIID